MIVFVHENNVKKCDARLQLGGTAADERTENTAKHPTMKLLDTENLVPHPTARAAIQRIPWHTHYVYYKSRPGFRMWEAGGQPNIACRSLGGRT